MPKTFMAVAVDTYDEENGIHPRYKQVEKKIKEQLIPHFSSNPLTL